MGKYKNSQPSGPVGRWGDYVTYYRLGKLTTRRVSKPTKFTDAQLSNQMGTALITFLLGPVQDFVKVSMKNSPKDPGWSAYNLASSVNKLGAITGSYPNKAVDFKKVILSIGDIPAPLNPKVSLTDNKISFTWEADLDTEGCDENDQIMCVAYLPETLQAFKIFHGAYRTEERQIVPLPAYSGKMAIETYLCFTSADRERVSNSVYTGPLVWDKQ